MTARERALVRIIENLIAHVEALGCTCIHEDYNARHCQPNRRREDSPCTGVSLAVRAELRMRRALRRGAK